MEKEIKMGRPSKYQEDFVVQAEKLGRLGALDTDLADFFNVHIDTIYAWKKEKPEFSEALKRGKAVADSEVAEKLIERAKGQVVYREEAIKVKKVEYDEKGKKCFEEETVEVVSLKQEMPADTTAIIFFLKNRRPDLWRDKQQLVHESDPLSPPTFTLKIDNS